MQKPRWISCMPPTPRDSKKQQTASNKDSTGKSSQFSAVHVDNIPIFTTKTSAEPQQTLSFFTAVLRDLLT